MVKIAVLAGVSLHEFYCEQDNNMKKDDESFKTESERDILNGRSSFMRKLLEALFLFMNFGIAMVSKTIVFCDCTQSVIFSNSS
jgi:hypothetical protein